MKEFESDRARVKIPRVPDLCNKNVFLGRAYFSTTSQTGDNCRPLRGFLCTGIVVSGSVRLPVVLCTPISHW